MPFPWRKNIHGVIEISAARPRVCAARPKVCAARPRVFAARPNIPARRKVAEARQNEPRIQPTGASLRKSEGARARKPVSSGEIAVDTWHMIRYYVEPRWNLDGFNTIGKPVANGFTSGERVQRRWRAPPWHP